MLISLMRIAFFVAAIGAVAFGVNWLLDANGGIVATMGGFEVSLSPLETVIVLLVFAVLAWCALKLVGLLIAIWHAMNGDETAISRFWARGRVKKGQAILSESMIALAAGDGKLAAQKAAKAEKYMQSPELTRLITAQAAEVSGDTKKAEDCYRELVQNEKTRFVGVRGLLRQKIEAGDTTTALKLAEKAFALKPRHVETQDTLLELQASQSDWKGARKTLAAKLKHGSLPRNVHRRRDAVLALSEAKDILNDDNSIAAREAAIEANRLSPDLIPAAVMAAEGYVEKGQKRSASRLLIKAWAAQPHPDLAAAFAKIEADEDAAARLKRFAKLVDGTEDHSETRMLMAELNLAAEDFPAARRALGDLFETDPTARSATLMAAICRGEGASDSIVEAWLTKALTAPRGPMWICDNCGASYPSWQAVCSACGGFDTLSWRRPDDDGAALTVGADMLPLLLSKPADEPVEKMPKDLKDDDAEIIDTDAVDLELEAR